MIPFFTTNDDDFAVIAVGGRPYGLVAIGADATGAIAIGTVATGVIALGCGAARGLVVGCCGVACGAVVFVCGAGGGLKVGAVGLGVSILDVAGMGIGVWPGPFPRRALAGGAISLDALEAAPPGDAALVDVEVVGATDDGVELATGGRRVTARAEPSTIAEARARRGERRLARLRFERRADDATGYREAPELELVCEAIVDRLGPSPPRGMWFLRVLASIAVAVGVAALTIPGVVW